MLFSLGSILSGTSHSMVQLIVMRSIQGLGAGAVGPIVMTMLGDLFTLKERAQVQGLFSAVWGLSSVGGPVVGGYLADHWAGRWVFLVCVPFALAAIVMLDFFVTEPKVERKVAPIDWAGAVFSRRACRLLLWIVLDGSRQGLVIGLVAIGVVGRVARLVRVSRAGGRRSHLADGPDDAADDRGLTGRAAFWWAAILFGLDTYVPLFVQGVRGGDATWAGRSLMPLFLAWAISVAVAARADGSLRVSPRRDGRLGLGRGRKPDPGGGCDLSRRGLSPCSSSGWLFAAWAWGRRR